MKGKTTAIWVRCTNCKCSGSLRGVSARIERDQTVPLFRGVSCEMEHCSCHLKLPTVLIVELTYGE